MKNGWKNDKTKQAKTHAKKRTERKITTTAAHSSLNQRPSAHNTVHISPPYSPRGDVNQHTDSFKPDVIIWNSIEKYLGPMFVLRRLT